MVFSEEKNPEAASHLVSHRAQDACDLTASARRISRRRKDLFFGKKVSAQVWRSPPRTASGKESGSFLKKRTKKL
jgi:hypothetical protein